MSRYKIPGTDIKAFEVTYMAWNQFRDALIYPRENRGNGALIVSKDCVMGAIDLDMPYL